MSIKVTLEFETAADAAAFLADFDGGAMPAGATAAEPAKPRGRPRAAAASTGVAASTAPAAAAATAAPAPVASAVPFKDVADVISTLAETNRDKAVAILAKHGAKLASELKPEQFASVVADCKAALAPAPTQSLI